MRRGSLDHVEVYLGRRGSGKSTAALEDTIAMKRELGAWAVGHDAAMRVPAQLLNGKPSPIMHHGDGESAKAWLVRRPDLIHLLRTENADDALILAIEVAHIGQEAMGDKAPPVVCLIDEGVLTSASPNSLPPQWRKFLATCRHDNVALKIAVQNPKLVHYSLFEMSTAVHLFNIEGDHALAYLAQQGVKSESIKLLPTLPCGERITHGKDMPPPPKK